MKRTKSRTTNSLAPGIARLAQAEGCSRTRHPGVVLWRMTASEPPTPTLYAASLIIVGSGRKQATLGDDTFAYDANHLLVVTSPLPMLCRTIASPELPVLTMVVEIDVAVLRELLLEIGVATTRARGAIAARTVFRTPLSREIEDAGARLLAHLDDDVRTRALARQTIRELLFLVLQTPHGSSLRAIAEGPSGQFAHVLRHINGRFAQRMSIEELARMANTSVPTFHARFKATTGKSPLQYIKALRLTRARQMLTEGGLVKAVAHKVGYESESQFSREYRRFFGAAPSASSTLSPRERT